MINVLMIESNMTQSEAVKKYFSSSSSIKLTVLLTKEDALLKLIGNYDVVICDMLLPNMDSMDLLPKIKENQSNSILIVTSDYYSQDMINDINIYEPNYILKKPYSFDTLEKILLSLGNKTLLVNNNSIKLKITDILHSLGVPSNIKGFQYIRECVELMYKDNTYLTKVTKQLYPTVADLYDTTWQRVERAIRHAIDVSWTRGDYDLMEELFGNSVDYDRAKPTNSEFIATLADRLRLNE